MAKRSLASPSVSEPLAAAEAVADDHVGGGEGRVADHEPDLVLGREGEDPGPGRAQQAFLGRLVTGFPVAFADFDIAFFVFELFALFFAFFFEFEVKGAGRRFGVAPSASGVFGVDAEVVPAFGPPEGRVGTGSRRARRAPPSTEQWKVAVREVDSVGSRGECRTSAVRLR